MYVLTATCALTGAWPCADPLPWSAAWFWDFSCWWPWQTLFTSDKPCLPHRGKLFSIHPKPPLFWTRCLNLWSMPESAATLSLCLPLLLEKKLLSVTVNQCVITPGCALGVSTLKIPLKIYLLISEAEVLTHWV